jgi:hypothetical protein
MSDVRVLADDLLQRARVLQAETAKMLTDLDSDWTAVGVRKRDIVTQERCGCERGLATCVPPGVGQMCPACVKGFIRREWPKAISVDVLL